MMTWLNATVQFIRFQFCNVRIGIRHRVPSVIDIQIPLKVYPE